MRKKSLLPLTVLLLLTFCSTTVLALTSGETYTVTVFKLESDGSYTEYNSTSAVADANGKLQFELSGIPTNDQANFVIFELTDSLGTVLRRGLAPAPPANSTNEAGLNTMATAQTDAMIAAGAVAGTDDPIMVAYLMIIIRSDDVSTNDAQLLAQIGSNAIRGDGGFIDYLQTNGVTSSQLATLREKLVYNNVAGTYDLRDYTSSYKSAIDNDNDGAMYEAGGFMADIFVDAAAAAGIDPALILGAHDAAGIVSEQAENMAIMANLESNTLGNSISQSMTAFHMRIATSKVLREYSNALTALGASGDEVSRFQSAATAFTNDLATIEQTFGAFFMDPDAFVAANDAYADAAAVQAALNTEYQTAFSTLQGNIQGTNAEITALKEAFVNAFSEINAVGDLPADFGQDRNFAGDTVNWPIPKIVTADWIATIVSNGGELTYDRATVQAQIAVPNNMDWLNGNGTRSDFSGDPSTLQELNEIIEDVQICDFIRYNIYDGGAEPSTAEEKAARTEFASNLAIIKGAIGGTTDGSTAVSTSEIDALIKLMLEPSFE